MYWKILQNLQVTESIKKLFNSLCLYFSLFCILIVNGCTSSLVKQHLILHCIVSIWFLKLFQIHDYSRISEQVGAMPLHVPSLWHVLCAFPSRVSYPAAHVYVAIAFSEVTGADTVVVWWLFGVEQSTAEIIKLYPINVLKNIAKSTSNWIYKKVV